MTRLILHFNYSYNNKILYFENIYKYAKYFSISTNYIHNKNLHQHINSINYIKTCNSFNSKFKMPKITKSVAKTRTIFSNLVSGSKRRNEEAEFSTLQQQKRTRERSSETEYSNIWRNSPIDLDGNYFSNFFYFIEIIIIFNTRIKTDRDRTTRILERILR